MPILQIAYVYGPSAQLHNRDLTPGFLPVQLLHGHLSLILSPLLAPIFFFFTTYRDSYFPPPPFLFFSFFDVIPVKTVPWYYILFITLILPHCNLSPPFFSSPFSFLRFLFSGDVRACLLICSLPYSPTHGWARCERLGIMLLLTGE